MTKYHKNPNIYVTEITLRVQDLIKSSEFYRSIMGFKVLKEEEKKVAFTIDGKNPIVTLMSGDIIPKIRRKTGLYHVAILLPNRHQLGLFLKNLRDQKYPIVGGSNHGVSEAIYLQDPDDNGIEVYADTSEDKWDRQDYSVNMVTERLDYEELINSTGDNRWDGAPKGTIIGHIHLHVSDLDESFKFYNHLGFELTQAMRHQAYFISTGGYHHHIGMNIWNGRGAEPLPENSAGMQHFSLSFPSEEIRIEKIRKLKDSGYLVLEIGNEIFAKDPSGNLIRFDI